MSAPVGSSYSTVKAAIVAALEARAGLSGVAVGYRAPEKATESQGESGSGEAIWLDDAEGDQSNVIFGGLPLVLDETYELKLMVQVLRPTTGAEGEQEAADRRVDELLYEFFRSMATDPTFGIEATDAGDGARFEHLQITSASSVERKTGHLSTNGHAAGAEIGLSVEARISFS